MSIWVGLLKLIFRDVVQTHIYVRDCRIEFPEPFELWVQISSRDLHFIRQQELIPKHPYPIRAMAVDGQGGIYVDFSPGIVECRFSEIRGSP